MAEKYYSHEGASKGVKKLANCILEKRKKTYRNRRLTWPSMERKGLIKFAKGSKSRMVLTKKGQKQLKKCKG